MADPRYSVSQITTFHSTYDDDLSNYVEGGAEGIGLWEFKLPDGDDASSLAKLRDSGLVATTCIPSVFSPYPITLPGPTDPGERVDAMCAAVERLAPFEPEVVLYLTGHPGDTDAAEARKVVVEGLRRVAKVAAAYGLTIGLEPLHRKVYSHWSMIGTIPETIELMDEIGEPNVALLYDVYHLWDTDGVLEHTVTFGDRIVPSVHICDWRADTRNDFDRALPGEGIMDLPALFGALEAGGVLGWVDLEIFSDDGTFTDQDFPDSYWKRNPVEVVKKGKEGFLHAWRNRKKP